MFNLVLLNGGLIQLHLNTSNVNVQSPAFNVSIYNEEFKYISC